MKEQMYRHQRNNHLPDTAMPKKIGKQIDPVRYASSGTEDAQQIALFMWAYEAKKLYPELEWMHAIPNGGFRTKSEAGRLRAMGVKSGVSDVFLPVKRGEYSGLYIEMKKSKVGDKRAGKATPEQLAFGEFAKSQGFGFCVCHSFEQAQTTVIQYLEYGKKTSFRTG